MPPHHLFRNRTVYATILASLQLLSPFVVNSQEPDPLRLGREVEPVTYAMDLELDPARDTYTGVARIELQFHVATNAFRFHARDLSSLTARLDGSELKLTHGDGNIVTATAPRPVPKGRHLLELKFENDYNRDGTGLYKVEKGEKSYLFTQMEATFARSSFPCWDEPGCKIPWRFTVTAPANVEVVGNMPIAERTIEGDRQTVSFGRTPPMPAYLVAFAVGPFDSMPIPGQSVPGRIYTTSGQTNLAEAAAKETQALLSALEEYFGIPYPYPKLDHIAVPEFLFGAMENVGAITYSDALLLTDPANTSYDTHRFIVMIVAHEMAHMWFGNLVTMQWWDDLWLNESFATWVSLKVGRQVRPDLGFDVMAHDFVSEAKRTDTQPSVKAIRRHFRGDDNIMEAVDALTYSKGQAILSMIEGWIGEEKFRQALARYFQKHRWGNAQADDLWAAFAATGDTALVEALRRFIEQPGLPALTFTPLEGNRLRISQKRYRTVTGGNATDQTWHVPVVIRFGNGDREQTARFFLTEKEQVFDAPGLDNAAWIYPNSGESGYYNWTLPAEHSARLAQHAASALSLTERLGLLEATALSVESGDTSAADALRVALSFLQDPEP
ncbi:MAG TPA: M1 family aminopeptidase [Verrucomicrobiota bacterium]|nr:M1 family aminopeptidase [Verrucomicrobiota bacterium]